MHHTHISKTRPLEFLWGAYTVLLFSLVFLMFLFYLLTFLFIFVLILAFLYLFFFLSFLILLYFLLLNFSFSFFLALVLSFLFSPSSFFMSLKDMIVNLRSWVLHLCQSTIWRLLIIFEPLLASCSASRWHHFIASHWHHLIGCPKHLFYHIFIVALNIFHVVFDYCYHCCRLLHPDATLESIATQIDVLSALV